MLISYLEFWETCVFSIFSIPLYTITKYFKYFFIKLADSNPCTECIMNLKNEWAIIRTFYEVFLIIRNSNFLFVSFHWEDKIEMLYLFKTMDSYYYWEVGILLFLHIIKMSVRLLFYLQRVLKVLVCLQYVNLCNLPHWVAFVVNFFHNWLSTCAPLNNNWIMWSLWVGAFLSDVSASLPEVVIVRSFWTNHKLKEQNNM